MYEQHQQLIKLGRNREQHLVEIAECDRLRSCVVNHLHLLIVKETPDTHHSFEMVLRHSIEMAFRSSQLFFRLLFHYLMIEAKET